MKILKFFIMLVNEAYSNRLGKLILFYLILELIKTTFRLWFWLPRVTKLIPSPCFTAAFASFPFYRPPAPGTEGRHCTFLERFYCFCFKYWSFSNIVFLKIKSVKKKKINKKKCFRLRCFLGFPGRRSSSARRRHW